jgi:hypothetical protein
MQTRRDLIPPRFLVLVLSLILVSCSGGGSDSPPTPTPTPAPASSSAEGLWSGSTNTNRTVAGVVLDDGTYYFLYSVPANPTLIAGMVQGNGTSNNGTLTSANARDFNLEGFGVLSPTLSGSYAERQSLSGSITYSVGGVTTFTSTFDPAYDTTPSLASLTGTYTGQAGSSGVVQSATVTVASTGVFTGVAADGCSFTGTATPRVRGNIFDVSITFGGAPCSSAGSTLVGIAYFDVPNNRLYAAAPTGDRTDALIFLGTKP